MTLKNIPTFTDSVKDISPRFSSVFLKKPKKVHATTLTALLAKAASKGNRDELEALFGLLWPVVLEHRAISQPHLLFSAPSSKLSNVKATVPEFELALEDYLDSITKIFEGNLWGVRGMMSIQRKMLAEYITVVSCMIGKSEIKRRFHFYLTLVVGEKSPGHMLSENSPKMLKCAIVCGPPRAGYDLETTLDAYLEELAKFEENSLAPFQKLRLRALKSIIDRRLQVIDQKFFRLK